MKVGRIARMVNRTETDSWVVFSAPQEVLECFVAHSVPTFALFGRFRRLPLAATGLDKVPAFRAAVRRLAELGHRRIVLLQPKHNREPTPALLVRETLAEMEANGIKTGPYNLPDWEDSREGFHRLLDELYRLTPPTALILDEAYHFFAAQQHLAHRGILAPQHVSLFCASPDPTFAWCQPTIAHIRYDIRPVLRRVVRWTDNVACGKDDRRQSFTKAEFVDGGTVGPVRGG